MTTRILLNTTRVGTVVHDAGGLYDTVQSAWEIPGIQEAGGRFVPATREMLAASALTQKLHAQGAGTDLLDTIMIVQAFHAGVVSYDDTLRAPPLGADTTQAAIDELKELVVGTSTVTVPFVTAGISDGYFCYLSGAMVVSKADASDVSTSKFAGATIGLANVALVQGIVENARFSSTSPIPAYGDSVFLSRADAEPGLGAAGKVSTTPSWPVIAEVGVVADVDAFTFSATRTAKVLLQAKSLLVRR